MFCKTWLTECWFLLKISLQRVNNCTNKCSRDKWRGSGALGVRWHISLCSYVAGKGNAHESRCSHGLFSGLWPTVSHGQLSFKNAVTANHHSYCVHVCVCARIPLSLCFFLWIPVKLPDVGVLWLYFITVGNSTPTLIREICKAKQKQISAWRISTKLHQTISHWRPTQRWPLWNELWCIFWLVLENRRQRQGQLYCGHFKPVYFETVLEVIF